MVKGDILRDTLILKELKKGAFISGQELAERLNISRASVWKRIKKLKKLGYNIESRPRIGYRLKDSSQLPISYELMADLRTEIIGKRIYHLEKTTSTQDVAKDYAIKGEQEGTVIIAETQTQGRGRRGRRWESPQGVGIYMSMILRPGLEAQRLPFISIMAGVAVAEAIRDRFNIDAKIKWPNDIYVENKKIGGILAESFIEPDIIRYVILGIGINLETPQDAFSKEIRALASSLREISGKSISKWELLKVLLESLDRYYLYLLGKEDQKIIGRWRQLNNTLGRNITVLDDPPYEAFAWDLASDGSLLIKTKEGEIQRLISADISIRY